MQKERICKINFASDCFTRGLCRYDDTDECCLCVVFHHCKVMFLRHGEAYNDSIMAINTDSLSYVIVMSSSCFFFVLISALKFTVTALTVSCRLH